MHKKIRVMAAAAIVTLSMSTTVLAYESPVNDVKNALIQMGVPSNYIGNIVDHLQRIKVSDKEVDLMMGKINEAKSIIGNTKDLSSLSTANKVKLQSIAVEAAKVVDINVKFGTDSKGVTTVVGTTANGGTVLQLNTLEVINLATNFDMNVVVDAVQEAADFSNDKNKIDLDGDGKPDKPEFKPEGGGKLNKTATPFGNMMFAGTSMIGMAGGVHFLARKKRK